MFPKGIQFANTPWDCAVEKFHQMRNYYPTSIVISGVHNVQEVTIQWENFISELKLTISQPLVAYKLTSEFLVTNFIEVNVDPCLCLSSLLSANFFNKCSKLDTHAFGLLISVIKEKFGYIGIQRFFPYIFKPLLSVELSVSEDGSYSLSQMELLNQLKKLTKFCIIILSYDFFCYLSKFNPAHFLFDWIRLAYCFTVSGIVRDGMMDCYTSGVQFLILMEAINNKHYYVFKAFIVDELWNSLRNVYLQAIGLSRNSSSSHNAKVSDLENVDCLQQTFTEQDLINCYYQEFGRLLKHSRITSNLNCSCEFVACDQTLDKLTCIIFDRLATLCLYHCGITVYSHASLYHVLFSEEHSVSVNNWSKFWLMPMKNFM